MSDSRKTIIAMDDSAIVLETVKAVFEADGFLVKTAENIAQLEAHCETGADLFVLDMQMPEAFGHDVGQVLRAVRKFRAPILIFSGTDEAQLAERVAEAELDGYVSKNDGVLALLARVRALLGEERAP